MGMNDFRYPVRSKGTVNFLDALVQNASTAINAIPGVPAVNSRRFLITAARLVAVQNLDYQFSFFADTAANGQPTADVDTNQFVSQITLYAGMGYQLGAAGLYYYYLDGLAVPYYMAGAGNTTTPSTLNVALTNLNAVAKIVNAAGALSATFWLEPQQA